MAINFSKLIAQLKEAQDKANRANEKRYREALGLAKGLGKAGLARIGKTEARQQAEATQRLISRGLGATTITEGAHRGIAGEAETARQELGERVTMQRIGLMERRSDVGPDLGLYASLLSAAGQEAGVGGGGRAVISGGLGPMASRGLDIFGRPMGRFGGGGFGGGGDGLDMGGGGGVSTPGAPSTTTGPLGAGMPFYGDRDISAPDPAAPAPTSLAGGTPSGGLLGTLGGIGGALAGGALGGLPGALAGGALGGAAGETYEQYKAKAKMPVSRGYWDMFIKGRK